MASDLSYSLFDTPLGTCGIVWSANGIVAVQLPEESDSSTRARVARLYPAAAESHATAGIAAVVEDICALLRGEGITFSSAQLDLAAVPEFNRRVYDITRAIAPGSTSTYGTIAAQLGDPTLARAVGQALGQNPIPIIVPCHRVLAANGRIGGFSGAGGAETTRRMLVIEGALSDLFS